MSEFGDRRVSRKGVPPPSSYGAQQRMKAVRQRDTLPEVRLRSLLHSMGLRYRLHSMPIPGLKRRADILFRKWSVAVYVDGCFWHGCPIHGTWPKCNEEFWRTKIESNRARDRETDRRLEAAGWTVFRVWEHEDPREAADRIARCVFSRRAST